MKIAEQKSITETAREELRDELIKEQTLILKKKLKDLHLAKRVVANLEREIQLLEIEVSQKVESL